ncbi:MAG: triose-phosphate isomerase [Kangiellaceae bacterium]|nr:triose-phosphate isomerase [Kangiellaceae bacterium]
MRRTLIAGNWKMHGQMNSIRELMSGISEQLQSDWRCEVLVCPPAVYISTVKQLIGDKTVSLGAQNVSEQVQGAFTGEVSADMLTDIGCQYVLVGHSERRSLYGESDELVADKFAAALKAGLKPVLCIGETLEQRENGTTMNVVKQQIDAVINLLGIDGLAKGVIAYEPVWAIGTGVTASPEQAQEVHAAIREHLKQSCTSAAQNTQILYGGSMKAANAEQLLAQPDIDGGLIGGASLKADEFIAICKVAG